MKTNTYIMTPTYFLQNLTQGYIGNSPFWWHKTDNGYTDRIDDAKQFTSEEADAIIQRCKSTHKFIKWPVKAVLSIAYRTIDVQDLKDM